MTSILPRWTVNEDGFSGYLSDVNAVEDMSVNAIKILRDIDTLNRFKANAQAQSLKFDLHTIVPQYEAIYQDTLSKCLVL